MLNAPTTSSATQSLLESAHEPPGTPPTRSPRRPATILAASLLTGLAAAATLVAGPFAGEREPVITGALLLGFAVGWALLVVLSARFTSQPQRWAIVPAAAMALIGTALIILAPEAEALKALAWIWPPLLLVLVVWMVLRVRRQPTGGLQRWLLYPVFAVLVLAAVGGGYETLRAATDPAVSHTGSQLVDIGDGRRLSIRCAGIGQPHGRARARFGRTRVRDDALDRPRRRPHHDRLCLRPRRPRRKRRGPRRRRRPRP